MSLNSGLCSLPGKLPLVHPLLHLGKEAALRSVEPLLLPAYKVVVREPQGTVSWFCPLFSVHGSRGRGHGGLRHVGLDLPPDVHGHWKRQSCHDQRAGSQQVLKLPWMRVRAL
jgi:hypothetical protein